MPHANKSPKPKPYYSQTKIAHSKKTPSTKMQSQSNLPGNSGLPLCLSGITHPLTLSKEMADHDLRRKAMKKQKIRILDANHDLGIVRNHGRETWVIRGGEIDGDLAGLLNDLIYTIFPCPAKAA